MIINQKIKIFLIVFVILLLALGLRFYLASFYNENYDLEIFKQWSKESVLGDIFSVYKKQVESIVYAPYLYLFFLKISGTIYHEFFSPSFNLDNITLSVLIKLVAIIFDILTGYLIFYLLRKQINLKAGIFGLVLYLFNPGVIYLSAYWGQIDSLYTFLIFLSLVFLAKNRFYLSWLFIILALFTKPQSVIFLPLLFFVNWKISRKILLKSVLLIPIFIFAILSPIIFTGNLINFIKNYFFIVGRYPYISVNAFNIWWPWSENFNWIPDTEKLFGLIPYFCLGLILLLIAYIFIFYLMNKYNHRLVYLAGSFIVFSFFMLPTQIHERYLFPVFALLCLALSKNKNILFVYIILSLVFFANLVTVLPFFPPVNLAGHSQGVTWLARNIGSLINFVVYIYFIYELIRVFKNNKLTKNESNFYPANLQ